MNIKNVMDEIAEIAEGIFKKYDSDIPMSIDLAFESEKYSFMRTAVPLILADDKSHDMSASEVMRNLSLLADSCNDNYIDVVLDFDGFEFVIFKDTLFEMLLTYEKEYVIELYRIMILMKLSQIIYQNDMFRNNDNDIDGTLSILIERDKSDKERIEKYKDKVDESTLDVMKLYTTTSLLQLSKVGLTPDDVVQAKKNMLAHKLDD